MPFWMPDPPRDEDQWYESLERGIDSGSVVTEDVPMNFDIYYDEDGEPQEPYEFDQAFQDEYLMRNFCLCSKGSRCMNCMERDGLTRGVAA